MDHLYLITSSFPYSRILAVNPHDSSLWAYTNLPNRLLYWCPCLLNTESPHRGQTPGPFRHFPRSPFQVRSLSYAGKLSQTSKRQRPLMLQRWIEKIVPALEWSKLRLNLLEAGDEAKNEESERSPDAVAQAVNHKMKERIRRSEFNGKMQTLISLVPNIKKVCDLYSIARRSIWLWRPEPGKFLNI